MVMWGLLLLAGLMVGCGSQEGAAIFMGCGICCVGIPIFVFNIMMWVAAFESHRECGPALWKFAVATVIMAFLQGGTQSTTARRNRNS